MSTPHAIRYRWMPWLVATVLCVIAIRAVAGQSSAATPVRADDAAAFKDFAARVQQYRTLQKSVESKLPALKPTDLPEMITAHQQALARTLREARPHAKVGDLFTSSICEAFRHASRAALAGPGSAGARAYMQPGAPNPAMQLVVNDVYPDAEPTTALPPALLAAYPPLPAEFAYRIVGRTLVLIDVRSRLIIDIGRRVLPPAT
jgi:hypothetical protein